MVTHTITGEVRGKRTAAEYLDIAQTINAGLNQEYTVHCVLGNHGCHMQIQKRGLILASYWPSTQTFKLLDQPSVGFVSPNQVIDRISSLRK